jgi:hypothetical protein
MHSDRRARLTVPDVAFVLASLFVLRALYPVFKSALDANATEFSTGEAMLFQLVLPGLILMLLYLLLVKSIRGAQA